MASVPLYTSIRGLYDTWQLCVFMDYSLIRPYYIIIIVIIIISITPVLALAIARPASLAPFR